MNEVGLICSFILSVMQLIGAVLIIKDAESQPYIWCGLTVFAMCMVSLMYLSGVFA